MEVSGMDDGTSVAIGRNPMWYSPHQRGKGIVNTGGSKMRTLGLFGGPGAIGRDERDPRTNRARE